MSNFVSKNIIIEDEDIKQLTGHAVAIFAVEIGLINVILDNFIISYKLILPGIFLFFSLSLFIIVFYVNKPFKNNIRLILNGKDKLSRHRDKTNELKDDEISKIINEIKDKRAKNQKLYNAQLLAIVLGVSLFLIGSFLIHINGERIEIENHKDLIMSLDKLDSTLNKAVGKLINKNDTLKVIYILPQKKSNAKK